MIFKLSISRLVELADMNIAKATDIRNFNIEQETIRIKKLIIEYNDYVDQFNTQFLKSIPFYKKIVIVQKTLDFIDSIFYKNKTPEPTIKQKITFEELVPVYGSPPNRHDDFETFLRKKHVETKYNMFYDTIVGYLRINRYYYGQNSINIANSFKKTAYVYDTKDWLTVVISITDRELLDLTSELSTHELIEYSY